MSTGKNPGTPRGPRGPEPENRRGNLQGGCDPDSPGTELRPVRPRTRSQGGVDQSSEAVTPSRNQQQGSRGEQPSRGDLATGCSGELQLLEATGWPSTSQPSYFLNFHHFELPVQSQEFLGPALRSTATMSHHVATPAPRASSQAFLPVFGRQQTDIIQFSFDSSGPFIPVGQGFHEQATVQVPDFCAFFTPNPIGDIGGRVLRSHAAASGHRSSASEVSPEVGLAGHRGRNLRRRATSPDSAALGNVPDTTSTPATPRRGRGASRSSRGASRSSRGASRSSRSASRSSRSQPQPGANPSTSGNEFLKRTLPATSSSPSRRPVRMRASSPSPPRWPYPYRSQHESSDSSSSSSSLSLDSSSDSSAPSSPCK
ncbi:EZH inhibitory protein [Peromyscus californicus insignis]|uniref:EZH inhibitory protein n=1 Tax=Peromyscus californicus insignis TaxID=564181 RepID=UPI0022A739C4|nr:EZH inhibitory protein [Peromyscus californicus insignis]